LTVEDKDRLNIVRMINEIGDPIEEPYAYDIAILTGALGQEL